MRPCFGCTKELLQAKVKAVYYLHDWPQPNPDQQTQYELLQGRIPEGIRQLEIEDPEADWAVSKKAPSPGETGHEPPP